MQSITVTCDMLDYTITNKQSNNAIVHDYNRDYICLETSSERNKSYLYGLMYKYINENKPYLCGIMHKYIFRQHMIWINAINEITNL